MDYDQFKKSPIYEAYNTQMKVAAVIYFCDPENKGVTLSEIKSKLEGDLDEREIDATIDLMSTVAMTLEPVTLERDGMHTQGFTLEREMKEGLEMLIRTFSMFS